MDAFWTWLAYRLPRRLAYWAAVRVLAHATTTYYTKELCALTPRDCLEAWRK